MYQVEGRITGAELAIIIYYQQPATPINRMIHPPNAIPTAMQGKDAISLETPIVWIPPHEYT